MCSNTNNVYAKITVALVIAAIAGLIAGIVWPSFFTNPVRLLVNALATSAVTLIILGVYLLFKNGRNTQNNVALRSNLLLVLFSALGSFILSVVTLSTTLTASLAGSILFGITVGFFVLLRLAITITLKYLINN